MIRKLFALTVLTFKEGVRDRALFGIGLFSLFMMTGSILVVSMFMRELDKVTVDINLSAITFAGLLLSFFVSINLMAKDIDRHTIYFVLSKSFSRGQYIWGKYLGDYASDRHGHEHFDLLFQYCHLVHQIPVSFVFSGIFLD